MLSATQILQYNEDQAGTAADTKQVRFKLRTPTGAAHVIKVSAHATMLAFMREIASVLQQVGDVGDAAVDTMFDVTFGVPPTSLWDTLSKHPSDNFVVPESDRDQSSAENSSESAMLLKVRRLLLKDMPIPADSLLHARIL